MQKEDYGRNEIDWWKDAQVIGPYKAAFRIFNANQNPKTSPYNLYNQYPRVEPLPIHLPNEEMVFFETEASILFSFFLNTSILY